MQQLPLWVSQERQEVSVAIDSQLQKAWLSPGPLSETADDMGGECLTYSRNEEFWSDALTEGGLRARRRVKLEGFAVLEWFPLSPGLFHTDEASDSREFALKYGRVNNADSFSIAVDNVAYAWHSQSDGPRIVHTLHGKRAM